MEKSKQEFERHSVEPLHSDIKQNLEQIANTIRGLTMDATQKANSGHPGLPMGCAEIGAYLYGVALQHNPQNANWLNRDRFILSAGHGSMLLYSCLHMAGFNLSIEDIKNFRQLHSRTPGHPEKNDTEGVETTTGPLGQGIGNAVGHALGMKILAERFNTSNHKLFENKIYVLMGDGDMMEGIASEVSNLAGHLKLDNLIVIYDANQICLDGPLSETFSEDTKMRYQAYGWEVLEMDGNDLDDIHSTLTQARTNQKRPTLVIARTIIGNGAPNKAGTHKAHGSPLGDEEVLATKEHLGIPQEPFYVPQSVKDYFSNRLLEQQTLESNWSDLFEQWKKSNPALSDEFEKRLNRSIPTDLEAKLKELEIKDPIASRSASGIILNALAEWIPQIIGGSADLSCSDMTYIKDGEMIAPGSFSGRNIKYGVREFGMGTIATGLSQTELFTPFVGTFLTFSDYMRNAIRLCAMMREQVIYQFTHDSIFLGEDGPTHQPVEHYAALRAIPHLHVIRPADTNEVKMAWLAALNYQGPTALILSRQNLPLLNGTDVSYNEGMARGAYILKKEKNKADYTLFATGSEVALAVDVAEQLEKLGKGVRVISMPCWELFEQQTDGYKETIVGGNLGKRVAIEAGSELGWHKYIGSDGIAICMETFGASAPMNMLQKEFGFTVESILERIL